jgi:hypothetical protein
MRRSWTRSTSNAAAEGRPDLVVGGTRLASPAHPLCPVGKRDDELGYRVGRLRRRWAEGRFPADVKQPLRKLVASSSVTAFGRLRSGSAQVSAAASIYVDRLCGCDAWPARPGYPVAASARAAEKGPERQTAATDGRSSVLPGDRPDGRSGPNYWQERTFFVAGYWLEPVDGRGFSFVVFETEEEARRWAPPADNWEARGVSINDVDFRRVAASA